MISVLLSLNMHLSFCYKPLGSLLSFLFLYNTWHIVVPPPPFVVLLWKLTRVLAMAQAPYLL